jgi:predicted nucleic acid-binding protein
MFSQKEMLVRMDSKLDAVLAQQVADRIDVVLVKARVDGLEQEVKERARREEVLRVESAVAATQEDVEEAKARQDAILRRINMASGAIGLVLFLAPVVWILVNNFVN